MDIVLGFVLGLALGWNVLPQPEFVKVLMAAVLDKFTKKSDTEVK